MTQDRKKVPALRAKTFADSSGNIVRSIGDMVLRIDYVACLMVRRPLFVGVTTRSSY